MIPDDWRPVHRADGERAGWLSLDGLPRTLLGTVLPLRDGEDPDAALTERGLAALDRRRFARLPDELVPGIDARSPADDWTWRAVVVIEVDRARCRIRLQLAPPAELRVALELPVPVGDLLLDEPPEE